MKNGIREREKAMEDDERREGETCVIFREAVAECEKEVVRRNIVRESVTEKKWKRAVR